MILTKEDARNNPGRPPAMSTSLRPRAAPQRPKQRRRGIHAGRNIRHLHQQGELEQGALDFLALLGGGTRCRPVGGQRRRRGVPHGRPREETPRVLVEVPKPPVSLIPTHQVFEQLITRRLRKDVWHAVTVPDWLKKTAAGCIFTLQLDHGSGAPREHKYPPTCSRIHGR